MFRFGVFPEERASLLRRMPGIHGIRRMGGCAGRSMNGKRSGPGTEWRKTYCPRTVPWYAVNMAGMSRFLLIVLLLCGAFPLFSRAQDIASPGMPVVDLDSETGKKIQEERAAICGFMVVLVLNQMILMLEEDPAEKMDLQKRIKHFWEFIPMNALARCPEDFRCAVRQWKDTCEKKMEESGAVPGDLEMGAWEDVRLLMEKYMVQEAIQPVMGWMMKKAGISALEMEDGAGKKEMLKRLKGIKEKLESGEVVIPAEIMQKQEG